MNSANKFKNVSDYSKYLTNKYKCLTPCKNASVLIDRSVMQMCIRDSDIPTRKRIIPCASPDMQPGTNVYLVGKTSTR